jgi:hypothetical protein
MAWPVTSVFWDKYKVRRWSTTRVLRMYTRTHTHTHTHIHVHTVTANTALGHSEQELGPGLWSEAWHRSLLYPPSLGLFQARVKLRSSLFLPFWISLILEYDHILFSSHCPDFFSRYCSPTILGCPTPSNKAERDASHGDNYKTTWNTQQTHRDKRLRKWRPPDWLLYCTAAKNIKECERLIAGWPPPNSST